jgi:GNAT superfamily N-acetyltransferase
MSSPDGTQSIEERQAPDLDARILAFGARHFGQAIRAATSADLGAMAHIHATSGTPGLLTDLGEPFLRDVYYAGILASPLGRAIVIDIAGEVAGFATFSLESDKLFSEIFRRRIRATLSALTKASFRKPRIAFDFAQTVFTVRGGGEGSDIAAEVVSLEVDPKFQGLGLGFVLLQAEVKELRAAGATRIKARILVENKAVERLHPPLGFRRGKEFRLHGREWVLLILDDANR